MDPPILAIVTGGSSGIGKEIAKGLMRERPGIHVILAARNQNLLEKVKHELEQEHNQSTCSYLPLDLASWVSVRDFAHKVKQDWLRESGDGATIPIVILVNNAGMWSHASDLTFKTNHLGPFLLTNLLLPCMKEHSRIINVSSRASFMGAVHFNPGGRLREVDSLSDFASLGFFSYARSKLCNMLFTLELQRRLKGRGIVALATSPGPVNTSLFNSFPTPLRWLISPLVKTLFRSPEEGAKSSLFAALAPELDVEGGAHSNTLFIHDNKPMEPSTAGRDVKLAGKLWTESERLTEN